MNKRGFYAVSMVLLALAGCTHFAVQDCPEGAVLGSDEPGTARLRTSHYRIVLASEAAAAARVLPYALMSSYAYYMGPCADPGNRIRVTHQREADLRRWLAESVFNQAQWHLVPTLGMSSAHGATGEGCEDDKGLMYHVWQRTVHGQTSVVVAFRGTSGDGDWVNGNLWWFTRHMRNDDQLSRSRAHVQRIIDAVDSAARARGETLPVRIVTTGHSLGGSLAQHVLYAFPARIEQAIVFDTSSVTGFVGVPKRSRVDGCACRPSIAPEARILRVYQTYEVLANLRIFHKIFFNPERHVHELRFPFEAPMNPIERHGMQDFTDKLRAAAGLTVAQKPGAWLASRDAACTPKVIEAQEASCRVQVREKDWDSCPQ
jgi:pimeloyl-ACP methyl ester carboxylesterase